MDIIQTLTLILLGILIVPVLLALGTLYLVWHYRKKLPKSIRQITLFLVGLGGAYFGATMALTAIGAIPGLLILAGSIVVLGESIHVDITKKAKRLI